MTKLRCTQILVAEHREAERNLPELWSRFGERSARAHAFSVENAGMQLAKHFAAVERRDDEEARVAEQAAERGDGDYALFFIPWFAHDEYAALSPDGWVAPPAFASYRTLHRLAADQLYWAYRKNETLSRACCADPDEPCWPCRPLP